MSTKEHIIRQLERLPAEELSIIQRLVELMVCRAGPPAAGRPVVRVGGRWKGVFPEDFDVDNALAEIRRG